MGSSEVQGPTAQTRSDHAMAGVDVEGAGRGRGLPAHGLGAARDEVAQERVGGLDQRGLGQEGVHERVGGDLDPGGAAGAEATGLLVGRDAQAGAEEAHHAGALEGEQLVEAVGRRAGVDEAEQRVPPAGVAAGRAAAETGRGQLVHEHAVQAQQQLEEGAGGGDVALDALAEVRLDVADDGVARGLLRVLGQGRRAEAGERLVEPGQRLLAVQRGRDAGDLVVDLGGDQRDHVGAEVEQAVLVLAGAEILRRDVDELAEAGRGALVAHLGVVGHAAAGADPEPGLLARGEVLESAGRDRTGRLLAERPRTGRLLVARLRGGHEAAAAALGEQGHEVDEGEAHAAHDHVLAGAEQLELGVGGLGGGEVGAAVTAGEGGELVAGRGGTGIGVPGGQQQQVGLERCAVLELDAPGARGAGRLAGIGGRRRAHGGGGGAVHGDGDRARQRREDLAEEPLEVQGLDAAGGEVGGLQRVDLGEAVGAGGGRGDLAAADPVGPFGERGTGDDGALGLDGLVGEDRDVGRAGVHQQQRALLGAPDAAGAGHVRIDDVHVQGRGREVTGPVGGGGVRAEPLEHADRARPAADHHQAGGGAVLGGARAGGGLCAVPGVHPCGSLLRCFCVTG
jgi:hypothetical protein